MLILLLTMILLPSQLHPEQKLQGRADLEDGFSMMYRIQDRTALAEMKLSLSGEGELRPDRLLFETGKIRFGSYRAGGVMRFISMSSLISQEAVKDSPALRADRSSPSSLERPAASLFHPGRGGVLCFGSEESFQGALWSSFYPGSYSTLHTGLSILLPGMDIEDPAQGEWYEEGDREQYTPLYHMLADAALERGSSSYRLYAALSTGPLRLTGCSLMPVFTYYGPFWDYSGRIWLNSPGWLNSNQEEAGLFYWENRVTMNLKGGLRTLCVWKGELPSLNGSGPVHELQCRMDYYLGSWPCLAEYRLIPFTPEEGETGKYDHLGRLQFGWNSRIWSLQSHISVIMDRERIQEISLKGEIKRSPRRGRYSRLRCTLVSEPGDLILIPNMEESFPLGAFRFKLTAAYEFHLPVGMPGAGQVFDALTLTAAVEWVEP